jgi:small-conductance mechanosensitive channel
VALEVILRYSLIAIGVMGVAYYIGINGTALVAVAGGLSVGIGFGIKEIISNFISSLWLLFEGSVRPGEILMINGDPCTVRKLGLRATQLRRGRDGAELLIPNQNFFTQEAESYTAEETSRRDVVVGSGLSPRTQSSDRGVGGGRTSAQEGAAIPAASCVHSGFRRFLNQLQAALLGAQPP